MGYEAGPTGYGLHRELNRRGHRCEIIAPSLIPLRAGERIKTDRHVCARLAELSRAGELKAIWVPTRPSSRCAIWRAREDAVNMRLKVRQQLKAFLLRPDCSSECAACVPVRSEGALCRPWDSAARSLRTRSPRNDGVHRVQKVLALSATAKSLEHPRPPPIANVCCLISGTHAVDYSFNMQSPGQGT